MTRSFAMLGLLCSTLTGCPTAVPGTDAGRDAARGGEDTGSGEDAGADDAATVEDTGTEADAGSDAGPPDAFCLPMDAGMTTGACTNDADLAALPMTFAGLTLTQHTSECITPPAACFTSAAGAERQMCVNDCIQSSERVNGAITPACTSCYALAADCTVAHCLGPCALGSDRPACIACQCEMCSDATAACSGIPDSRCACM
jgi:hypothetical protein